MKALRILVDTKGLLSDLTCVLEAEPLNLILKDKNLVLNMYVSSLFKLAISLITDFCANLTSSTTSFKKCNVMLT